MWLVVTLVLGLPLGSQLPPWVDLVRQVAEGTVPCKHLTVRYEDGSDALGWTRIVVRGGWAQVVREEPGVEARRWAGRPPRGTCQRLARSAVDGRIWTVRRVKRRPGEDETRPVLRLTVRDAGAGSAQAKPKRLKWILPGFAVQDASAFARLRGDLLVVARHLSDGEVLY